MSRLEQSWSFFHSFFIALTIISELFCLCFGVSYRILGVSSEIYSIISVSWLANLGPLVILGSDRRFLSSISSGSLNYATSWYYPRCPRMFVYHSAIFALCYRIEPREIWYLLWIRQARRGCCGDKFWEMDWTAQRLPRGTWLHRPLSTILRGEKLKNSLPFNNNTNTLIAGSRVWGNCTISDIWSCFLAWLPPLS